MSEGRGEWGSHYEYFLTSLGLAVGLGNIWRFPYICYNNGGGTFLIPYLIALLLCGLPLYFMEMILGQYAGTSCTKVFSRMAPVMKGLGYGILSIPTMMTFYYTVIMAWAFYYMFMGFRSTLPWASCLTKVLEDFSTEKCYSKADNDKCLEESADTTFYNKTCWQKSDFCQNFNGEYSGEDQCTIDGVTVSLSKVTDRIAPSEEFFKRRMYGQSGIGTEDTWESWGEPRWEMIGCLALCYLIIALSLVKGVQSYGKLSYFITLFPYVILTTFLIILALQDGFSKGITDFYMSADWDRLFSDFNVWVDAFTQIFYSLGVGVGSQLLLCSYNKFNNNCHRDAWLIALGNSLTSIYAGFIVFGTLGVLAENNGVPVEDVITEGPGLVFQTYPEAITLMPHPPTFNFLFFLMLCLLAMSSIVGMWEPTVAAVLDEFPKLRERRSLVYIASCVFAFLGGICMCFPSGIFMFNIINDHSASTVLYMSLIEIIIVMYVFGIKNFLSNIDEMDLWMPKVLKWFWTVCWVLVTPGLVLTITIIGFVGRELDDHEGYVYPTAAQVLGYLVELSPVVFVLIVALVTIVSRVRGGAGLRSLVSSEKWKPRADREISETVGRDNRSFQQEQNVKSTKIISLTEI